MAKKIRSKLPDPEATRNTEPLEWLFAESERSAVILGGSVVDEDLLLLLLKVMRPTSGPDDRLFEPERPLGPFSARITLAHRMGLVDDDFMKALHRVRNMRNDFAHRVEKASLSDNEYRDRIVNLATWAQKNTNYQYTFEHSKAFAPDLSDHQRHWVVSIVAISMRLRYACRTATPVNFGRPLGIL